jgi:hypothetical protein
LIDGDCEAERKIIIDVISNCESPFTTMIFAKTPERVKVESMVHGIFAECGVPGAKARRGCVGANNRRSTKCFFIGILNEE